MLPSIQAILMYVLLSTIAVDGNFLTSDYLHNAYVITNKNFLEKYDSSGTLLFHYNQNRYGTLTTIDATNPLKLILLYKDFGTMVWLDNTLSEVGTLSFQRIGINSISAICFSPKDNNIWAFDDQEFKLRKIDNNGNVILESSDMFQLLGHAIHPVYMLERDQFIYLTDPQLGVLVFDAYGIYKETIPIKNIYKFMVRNNNLYYWEGKQVFTYDINSLEEKYIMLPENDIAIDISIESNRLFLLQKNNLKIYRF